MKEPPYWLLPIGGLSFVAFGLTGLWLKRRNFPWPPLQAFPSDGFAVVIIMGIALTVTMTLVVLLHSN